jgi:hypothetical protein
MNLTNNFYLSMLEAPSQYLVILKLKYPNLLLVMNHESRSLSGVNVALVAWVHLASATRTYAPLLSPHAYFTSQTEGNFLFFEDAKEIHEGDPDYAEQLGDSFQKIIM